MNDVQIKSLGLTHKVNHPRLGPIEMLGQPIHLEGVGEPPSVRSPAPEHGEHSEEILAGLLGLDKRVIEDLRTRGVI